MHLNNKLRKDNKWKNRSIEVIVSMFIIGIALNCRIHSYFHSKLFFECCNVNWNFLKLFFKMSICDPLPSIAFCMPVRIFYRTIYVPFKHCWNLKYHLWKMFSAFIWFWSMVMWHYFDWISGFILLFPLHGMTAPSS